MVLVRCIYGPDWEELTLFPSTPFLTSLVKVEILDNNGKTIRDRVLLAK